MNLSNLCLSEINITKMFRDLFEFVYLQVILILTKKLLVRCFKLTDRLLKKIYTYNINSLNNYLCFLNCLPIYQELKRNERRLYSKTFIANELNANDPNEL